MITAVMLTGHGAPALARDTMMAIVMIVLNGLVGTSLLLGGLRYHEQTYNPIWSERIPRSDPTIVCTRTRAA